MVRRPCDVCSSETVSCCILLFGLFPFVLLPRFSVVTYKALLPLIEFVASHSVLKGKRNR